MGHIAPAFSLPPAPLPDTHPESSRHLATAVRRLNEANYAGDGREVTFSVDRATRLPVVRILDKETGEVISQLPAEFILQQAATNT